MSARFYCPDLAQGETLRLSGDESRHVSRVCRLGVGDEVELFDGCGVALRAKIVKVDTHGVELVAIGPAVPEPPAPFSLTLASAVPKADRFDWLVEKATELGVERLIPLVTERSVVEPGSAKLERLRRSIIEASKQCGRNRLMVLDAPVRLDQITALHTEALRLLADPQGTPPSSWPIVPARGAVILAVGPEGGFTAHERSNAERAGWHPVSLSSHILRIETAGLAGCAALFTRAQTLETRA